MHSRPGARPVSGASALEFLQFQDAVVFLPVPSGIHSVGKKLVVIEDERCVLKLWHPLGH